MKRPTQNDVARLAGVSRATVSYVLNGQTDGRVPISDETFQRVTRAIEELGYEPDARAQALRSGSTNTIGVIISDLGNPHFCEYATGIEQAARAAGYHMLLVSTGLNENLAEDVFKDLARRRIDGLFLVSAFVGMSEEAHATLRLLRERQLPIVELNDRYDVDGIVSDYSVPTQEVMTYLTSMGHRRIGMVYGVASPENGDDRLQPYQDHLKAAGLFDPELIVRCGPTIEDGYQAALHLLRLQSRPTALLAINDLLAFGSLRAAGDLKLRVPEDVSLVGFDDILMAQYFVPRLTTASRDTVESGRKAFQLLLARIQDPGRPHQKIRVPARLVIRESTGPAPEGLQ